MRHLGFLVSRVKDLLRFCSRYANATLGHCLNGLDPSDPTTLLEYRGPSSSSSSHPCQGPQGQGLVVFDVRAPAALVLERTLAQTYLRIPRGHLGTRALVELRDVLQVYTLDGDLFCLVGGANGRIWCHRFPVGSKP